MVCEQLLVFWARLIMNQCKEWGMVEETTMRRTPKQKRSQQRVDQILDAAARLAVHEGYENVSTNAIAKEAETSIGSLYQFFPNKDAVYLALAQRYVDELSEMLAQTAVVPDEALAIQDRFDQLLDQLALFYLENPGFQPLLFGSYKTAVNASGEEILNQMVDGMDAILAQNTEIPEPPRRLQATVIIHTLKSTLPLIVTEDEAESKAALLELKRLMRGYLAAIIEARK
jgi:AcrR family transcriptional regulator